MSGERILHSKANVSPYMIDALMRDYWCAVGGHIVSWNAGGTSDTYRPDEAPCARCGRVIKLEANRSGVGDGG